MSSIFYNFFRVLRHGDIHLGPQPQAEDRAFGDRHRQSAMQRIAIQPQLLAVAFGQLRRCFAAIGFIIHDLGMVCKQQNKVSYALHKCFGAAVVPCFILHGKPCRQACDKRIFTANALCCLYTRKQRRGKKPMQCSFIQLFGHFGQDQAAFDLAADLGIQIKCCQRKIGRLQKSVGGRAALCACEALFI